MPDIPSLSSKDFAKLLTNNGAQFIRQGATDHAIYARILDEKRYTAPVQMGKKSLDPVYIKLVLKQLKFSKEDIAIIFK